MSSRGFGALGGKKAPADVLEGEGWRDETGVPGEGTASVNVGTLTGFLE